MNHEIAFGTECLWWGRVADAAIASDGVVATIVCPFCGGACSTHATETSFLDMARRYEIIGFPRHREMIRAIRGRCFRSRAAAWAYYVTTPIPIHRS